MSSKSSQTEMTGRQASAVTINFSDTIRLPKKRVEWTPHGVSLLTKWPFAEGAEVEFAFEHAGRRHCCVGIVVTCNPVPRQSGFFDTLIYFVEVPCDELRHAACDCKLAHPRHRPPAT